MNSKWHLIISLVKSGLRIIGLLSIIFTTNLLVFVALFFGAEILGVAEEFGDKR